MAPAPPWRGRVWRILADGVLSGNPLPRLEPRGRAGADPAKDHAARSHACYARWAMIRPAGTYPGSVASRLRRSHRVGR
jgi:hypothetical protein